MIVKGKMNDFDALDNHRKIWNVTFVANENSP